MSIMTVTVSQLVEKAADYSFLPNYNNNGKIPVIYWLE